jgi:hypothetical protein
LLNANTFESISLTGGNAGVIAENLNVDATIFVEFALNHTSTSTHTAYTTLLFAIEIM